MAVLVGSALPELVLGFRYPIGLMHSLSFAKAAFFILLLVLTCFIRKTAPLRPLLAILLTLHVAIGAFASIVASACWKAQVSGIDNRFIRVLLGIQFGRVGVTLVVLAVLFLLFRTPSRFYLRRGDMGAKASRVAWLGISGKSSWNRVGTVLTVILSLGTFSFLAVSMHPALAALPGVLSILPFVLLFSITNALGEEISYRLAILAPVADVVPPGHAVLMTAAYFGLAHYYGIPSGSLGVVMAGFLGWLAGRSILDTKGVAWAFAMHVVQDVWIFWFMAATFSLQAK